MPKEIDFQLFEASGRFRYPLSDEQRATLTPEILARVVAVEAAAKELAAVTAQLKEAEQERKVNAAIFDQAKLNLDTIRPAPTALQEQRRMMLPAEERARLGRLPVDPAIKEAILAAAAAEDYFEGSKVTCRNLQAAQVHAKTVVARRVEEFQSEFQPVTPGELIKSHLKAEQARRAAGTYKPPEQAPPASVLDAYMQSGAKGPLGVRSARQASRHPDGSGPTYPASMRGQRVAPPPPAQAPWRVKPHGPRQ
jgi:hypothetical protein